MKPDKHIPPDEWARATKALLQTLLGEDRIFDERLKAAIKRLEVIEKAWRI